MFSFLPSFTSTSKVLVNSSVRLDKLDQINYAYVEVNGVIYALIGKRREKTEKPTEKPTKTVPVDNAAIDGVLFPTLTSETTAPSSLEAAVQTAAVRFVLEGGGKLDEKVFDLYKVTANEDIVRAAEQQKQDPFSESILRASQALLPTSAEDDALLSEAVCKVLDASFQTIAKLKKAQKSVACSETRPLIFVPKQSDRTVTAAILFAPGLQKNKDSFEICTQNHLFTVCNQLHRTFGTKRFEALQPGARHGTTVMKFTVLKAALALARTKEDSVGVRLLGDGLMWYALNKLLSKPVLGGHHWGRLFNAQSVPFFAVPGDVDTLKILTAESDGVSVTISQDSATCSSATPEKLTKHSAFSVPRPPYMPEGIWPIAGFSTREASPGDISPTSKTFIVNNVLENVYMFAYPSFQLMDSCSVKDLVQAFQRWWILMSSQPVYKGYVDEVYPTSFGLTYSRVLPDLKDDIDPACTSTEQHNLAWQVAVPDPFVMREAGTTGRRYESVKLFDEDLALSPTHVASKFTGHGDLTDLVYGAGWQTIFSKNDKVLSMFSILSKLYEWVPDADKDTVVDELRRFYALANVFTGGHITATFEGQEKKTPRLILSTSGDVEKYALFFVGPSNPGSRVKITASEQVIVHEYQFSEPPSTVRTALKATGTDTVAKICLPTLVLKYYPLIPTPANLVIGDPVAEPPKVRRLGFLPNFCLANRDGKFESFLSPRTLIPVFVNGAPVPKLESGSVDDSKLYLYILPDIPTSGEFPNLSKEIYRSLPSGTPADSVVSKAKKILAEQSSQNILLSPAERLEMFILRVLLQHASVNSTNPLYQDLRKECWTRLSELIVGFNDYEKTFKATAAAPEFSRGPAAAADPAVAREPVDAFSPAIDSSVDSPATTSREEPSGRYGTLPAYEMVPSAFSTSVWDDNAFSPATAVKAFPQVTRRRQTTTSRSRRFSSPQRRVSSPAAPSRPRRTTRSRQGPARRRRSRSRGGVQRLQSLAGLAFLRRQFDEITGEGSSRT